VEERRDDRLLVEAVLRSECQGIDAVERAIRPVPDQSLDGIDDLRLDRLTQKGKKSFGFAHEATSFERHDGLGAGKQGARALAAWS
jgi:hypothetical protein